MLHPYALLDAACGAHTVYCFLRKRFLFLSDLLQQVSMNRASCLLLSSVTCLAKIVPELPQCYLKLKLPADYAVLFIETMRANNWILFSRLL